MKYLKNIAISLSILVGYSAQSQSFTKELLKNSSYSFSSTITVVESSQVNTQKAGLNISAKSNVNLAPELSFNVKLNLLFEEGSHLSLNDDSFAVNHDILYPSYFYLSYSPYFFLNSKLGIISSSRQYGQLLFNESDLGANIDLKVIDYNNFQTTLFGDIKSINSNLTQTRTGKISKSNSYYSQYGIELNFDTHFISTGAVYSKYEFYNLNYNMAQESRFMGASVNGTSNTSEFVYDYYGDNAQFYLSFNQLLSKVSLYSQYVKNQSSTKAAILYGANIGFLERYKFVMESYDIPSDSLLAIYAPINFGRTNRKGEHFQFSYNNHNSTYSANFYQNSVKKTNIFQDELSVFTLEFSYKL